MASRQMCATCLRGLRQQFAQCQPVSRAQLRHNSTSRSHSSKKPAAAATAYQTPRPGPSSARPSAPAASPEEEANRTASLAKTIRQKVPSFTETYVAYGACEKLVRECARVAKYNIPEEQRKNQRLPGAERGVDVGIGKGWWYEQFGLTPCFNTWAQITFLHMWLLTVRLRQFPAAHAPAWHQHLTDHFFYLAEERMEQLHGLSMQGMRNRYLKDLFIQWRGLTAAYDQGIVEGDAVLAAAVWRNVCGADENIDLEKLAMVVSYIRSVLKGLEGISDEDISMAEVVFEDPAQEADVVRPKSKLWNQSLESIEELAADAASRNPGTAKA